MDNIINDLSFYLGLTFIIMHEMDAIRCKEWRIFPGMSSLNDYWGFRVFMVIHVPLFVLLLYGIISAPDPASVRTGLDYFFIIHGFLHVLLLKHSKNEFKDWISWVIIIGAGLFGGIDLAFA